MRQLFYFLFGKKSWLFFFFSSVDFNDFFGKFFFLMPFPKGIKKICPKKEISLIRRHLICGVISSRKGVAGDREKKVKWWNFLSFQLFIIIIFLTVAIRGWWRWRWRRRRWRRRGRGWRESCSEAPGIGCGEGLQRHSEDRGVLEVAVLWQDRGGRLP